MIFAISGKDYSDHVQMSTYDINKETQYSEWQSADGLYHRDFLRTRIEGKFEMVFVSTNSEDYLEFLDYIAEKDVNNLITCDIYVGNTGAVEEGVKFYYEIEFDSQLNPNEDTYIDRIKLKLEER